MGLLQNESLAVKEEQYREKNSVLGEFGEQVDKWTFYEDVFGDTEKTVPVILSANEHLQAMTLDSAMDFSAPRDDVYISGCTYFHDWYSKKTAHDIYAFIIDLDSVWSGGLLSGLRSDWQLDGVPTRYAKPTYIVNSGTGLHLYFVLAEPIPCFGTQIQEIEKLYREIALQQTAKAWIGQKPQIQWFGQSFRMVGSLTKDGFETTAFRYGEKWDIQDLAKWYGIEKEFRKRGEHEDFKPIRKQRKRKKGQRKGFTSNRAFYDYTLRTVREKTHEGHRYTSMCALSVIAWKCKVPEWEVEKDLESLLPYFNKGSVRTVKANEIKSAMKMYNARAMETPRERLEDWLGWEYKPIKRNGRKRDMHLKLARNQLALLKEMGETSQGRPKQSIIVEEWQEKHPNGKKIECHRETGLSRPTIDKWWK